MTVNLFDMVGRLYVARVSDSIDAAFSVVRITAAIPSAAGPLLAQMVGANGLDSSLVWHIDPDQIIGPAASPAAGWAAIQTGVDAATEEAAAYRATERLLAERKVLAIMAAAVQIGAAIDAQPPQEEASRATIPKS